MPSPGMHGLVAACCFGPCDAPSLGRADLTGRDGRSGGWMPAVPPGTSHTSAGHRFHLRCACRMNQSSLRTPPAFGYGPGWQVTRRRTRISTPSPES